MGVEDGHNHNPNLARMILDDLPERYEDKPLFALNLAATIMFEAYSVFRNNQGSLTVIVDPASEIWDRTDTTPQQEMSRIYLGQINDNATIQLGLQLDQRIRAVRSNPQSQPENTELIAFNLPAGITTLHPSQYTDLPLHDLTVAPQYEQVLKRSVAVINTTAWITEGEFEEDVTTEVDPFATDRFYTTSQLDVLADDQQVPEDTQPDVYEDMSTQPTIPIKEKDED